MNDPRNISKEVLKGITKAIPKAIGEKGIFPLAFLLMTSETIPRRPPIKTAQRAVG